MPSLGVYRYEVQRKTNHTLSRIRTPLPKSINCDRVEFRMDVASRNTPHVKGKGRPACGPDGCSLMGNASRNLLAFASYDFGRARRACDSGTLGARVSHST